MTLAGEAVIIWTATGLSVIAMSAAEKWGRVFHIGFHVSPCTQHLQARFYTFYVMFSFYFYEGTRCGNLLFLMS